MFWRAPRDKSVMVDPQRESQRLRENAALGQQPVAGDTPIIQRQERHALGHAVLIAPDLKGPWHEAAALR